MVAFSEPMTCRGRGLRAFLFERMYRHYRVNRMASKARRIVQELFQLLLRRAALPADRVARSSRRPDAAPRPRALVADYIAGMTDRFALDEHCRLFDRYATT